ncbi:MAG: 5-methyltetrahydropteroyltriglutamate--homocysteine S-methyltransferase, partial [Giesbergeria sp.]
MSQAALSPSRPVLTHTLGFPRMGAQRELKFALESHWRGDRTAFDLQTTAAQLRQKHWQAQADAGLGFVTVGDFALYDHVANHIQLLGCEPARFALGADTPELDRYFAMARGVSAGATTHEGCSPGCTAAHATDGQPALEMTKWFDTNYHYLVPEFSAATTFRVASERLFDEVQEAQALGHPVKAVLLGPLSFLWLGKSKEAGFDRFTLLEPLLSVYEAVLARLKAQGVQWVQIDEPILGLDLPAAWRHAFEPAYWQLARSAPQLLLATYFSPLSENLRLACQLPVAGLHVDAVRAPEELVGVADWLPSHKVLSVGVVDGRNIWRTDLDAALARLAPVVQKHQGALWLAPSCSLLHVPFSLAAETALDPEVRSWLAFAVEKLGELRLLASALTQVTQGEAAVGPELAAARAALAARHAS